MVGGSVQRTRLVNCWQNEAAIIVRVIAVFRYPVLWPRSFTIFSSKEDAGEGGVMRVEWGRAGGGSSSASKPKGGSMWPFGIAAIIFLVLAILGGWGWAYARQRSQDVRWPRACLLASLPLAVICLWFALESQG